MITDKFCRGCFNTKPPYEFADGCVYCRECTSEREAADVDDEFDYDDYDASCSLDDFDF